MSENGLKQGFPISLGQFELAKWLAIAAMAVDHYGKIVALDLYFQTHLLGRISFPLLAWIIACRLATQPWLVNHYLKWLIPFAFLSQPIFVLAGRDVFEGNILFTLALGVGAIALIERVRDWRLIVLLLPVLGLSLLVEFGPVGVASIVVLHLLAQRRFLLTAWAVGPLGVLANISLTNSETSLLGLAALFASIIAIFTLRFDCHLPRLPKITFYAFYPLHLLALHLWGIA